MRDGRNSLLAKPELTEDKPVAKQTRSNSGPVREG